MISKSKIVCLNFLVKLSVTLLKSSLRTKESFKTSVKQNTLDSRRIVLTGLFAENYGELKYREFRSDFK